MNSAPAFSWTVLAKAALTLVLGVVVGAMGTIMHRSVQPWGLVLSFLLVLTAAATARAFGGLVAWIGFVLGLGVAVLALSQVGPGGDVLVRAGQRIGVVWLVGAGVVAIGGMLLPRAWFSDEPLPARTRQPVLASDVGGEPDVRP